jgi:hypothetical protein
MFECSMLGMQHPYVVDIAATPRSVCANGARTVDFKSAFSHELSATRGVVPELRCKRSQDFVRLAAYHDISIGVRPRQRSVEPHVQQHPMSPELEALDQLQGGDMPLRVVAALFPDEAHTRRAIAAMLAAGDLTVIDAAGAAVALWQVRDLERQPGSWHNDTEFRLAITTAGARRIGG